MEWPSIVLMMTKRRMELNDVSPYLVLLSFVISVPVDPEGSDQRILNTFDCE
jgi:hypothetical protein